MYSGSCAKVSTTLSMAFKVRSSWRKCVEKFSDPFQAFLAMCAIPYQHQNWGHLSHQTNFVLVRPFLDLHICRHLSPHQVQQVDGACMHLNLRKKIHKDKNTFQVSKLPFCQGTAVPRRRRMRNLDIHWIGKTNLDKMQDIYSSKPIFSKVWSFCVLCLSFPTRKSTKKAQAEWRAKSMRQDILLSTASALKAAHTAQRLDAAPQRCEQICRLPPRGSIAAGVAGGLWTNCRESYKFCTSCKLVKNKQLAYNSPKQQEKGVRTSIPW